MAKTSVKTTVKKTSAYASFWQRLLAGVVDVMLVAVGYHVVVYFSVMGVPWERALESLPPSHAMMSGTASYYFHIIMTEIAMLLYFVIFLSSPLRATLGMQSLHLQLADAASGKAVSWKVVLLRYVSLMFSFAFLGIGFLMMLWSDKRQALHDRLTNTVVLQKA